MKGRQQNIVLQRPLAHQQPVIDDPARFKLLRWGRRAGKTRVMHVISAVGHGNKELDAKLELEAKTTGCPRQRAWWPGFLNGGRVCWTSRDNPQMELVWAQEMRPRYKGHPGIHWHEQEKLIEMRDGSGSLDLRSFENIDSARGFDFDTILTDESGHWNLDVAWNSVLRATLVDRKGSAVIASTTKRGSYFNDLCERVQSGQLSKAWKEFYATAFDNPKLDPAEIRELIAEFPEGSLDLEQEVWAKLVTGGGLAFKEWNDKVHIARMEPPPGWAAAASMDWGYASNGWFGLAFCGPDKEVFFRYENYFKETPPFELGKKIGNELQRWPLPPYVVCGDDMWYTTQGPVTIAEKFSEGLRASLGAFAPALVQSPKGPGSRRTRKILMHEGLKWTHNPDDATKLPPPWFLPRLRFHPDCYHAIRTLPKLPLDERETDVVDTDAEDHPFDGATMLLMSRTPIGERRDLSGVPGHPGFTGHRRKKPWEKGLEPEPWSNQRYQKGASA